jgi:hypothetical protein
VNNQHVPVLILGMLAPMATGYQPPASPSASAPEGGKRVQKRLADVLELPRQTLTFKPSRDDITVGCAIFSFNHSSTKEMNLDAVRINGLKPDNNVLYLKEVGKNKFELPALKIEFSSEELGGPLYLAIKVYFNGLTNRYDSLVYDNVPDRYALLSYCTKEDDDPSKVNDRLGANRARTLKAFKDALAKPFPIKLNQQPLMAEWGRYPMLPPGDRLSAAEIKAVEQTLRDKGEQYLISIAVPDSDHARVFVGEGTFFRAARLYTVVRSDGAWRVESVKPVKD